MTSTYNTVLQKAKSLYDKQSGMFSFDIAFVAGKKLVPIPAAGIIAFGRLHEFLENKTIQKQYLLESWGFYIKNDKY